MNSSAFVLRHKLRCLLFLVLLPLLVYFNTLKGSFHFDDQSLLGRSWVSDIGHFRKEVQLRSIENRPILLLTYALNNTLHPGQVFGFHLTSLLLHVLVSILIFHILQRTQSFLAEGTGVSGLPLMAAFLFALHPLNTDSVSYISSRSSVLATFFYLLTLYGFLTVFSRPSKYRGAGMAVFCVFGFYLALASKLIAVTLPALLGGWFLLFVHGQKGSYFGKIDKRTMFIVGAAGFVFLAAIFYLVLAGWLFPRDQGMQLFGRGAYFLLQTKVVVFYYIKQFFLPFNLNIDVGFPFSVFRTDLQIPLAMAVIAAIVVCVFKWGDVFLKMGTVWFFLTLMPTSSFIPLNDLAVEHHSYLPLSLGLCLCAGWVVARLDRARRLPFAVVLFAVLGLLTVSRNAVWLNDFTLWQDAAAKNPLSPRTQSNFGKAWYEKAEFYAARGETVAAQQAREQALAHFEKAIANLSGYADRFYNEKLFHEYFDQLATPGLKRQSEDSRLLADFAEPHYNIASLYLDLGRYADAEREYRAVIGIDPNFFSAYFGLGSVYNQIGRYEEAIHWYKQDVERRKAAGEADDPLVHLNLGEVYGKTARYEEAAVELKQAVQLSPLLDKAYYNLGIVYTQLGEYDNAKQAYLTALKLNDRFVEARTNLGNIYLHLQQYDLAVETFEDVLRQVPPSRGREAAVPGSAWVHRQLGLIYWEIRKDKGKALEHLERVLDIDPRQREEISTLIQKISAS